MDRKTVIFGIAEEQPVRMDDGALIAEWCIELMRQLFSHPDWVNIHFSLINHSKYDMENTVYFLSYKQSS